MYGLCNQTVTVYRKEGNDIRRRVVQGCNYVWWETQWRENGCLRGDRKFSLVIPGAEKLVQPGDRIFDGTGPETVDWKTFVPALVPGLSQAAYARPRRWQGDILHWEVGRK